MNRRCRTKSDPTLEEPHIDLPIRWKSARECGAVDIVEAWGHRHEDVALRPEFLEQLKRLHAEFRNQACLKSVGDGLTDMVLDDAFGEEGSWMLSGKLPEDGMVFSAAEEPFSVRPWVSCPSALKGGTHQELLQRWGAAALNTKGRKSATDDGILGQDNCCLARLGGGWELAGVFDGHGPCGHWPATRAARTMPYFLQSGAGAAMLREGDVEGALRFAFEAVETELEAESAIRNVDLQISGCTAVVALHHAERDSVWLATVGDSRAVLLSPGQGVLEETSDHKPSRQDEAERIIRLGGDVLETKYGDGYIDERVYIKGEYFPGLGVTRSFGDCVVKDIGVSAEPEVVRWSLEGKPGLYLLLCSDGVWEFLGPQEVADCVLGAVKEGRSAQQAIQALLEASRQAWKEKEDEDYCDDITIVLVPLAKGVEAPAWDAVAGSDEKAAVAKALAECGGDSVCSLQ